MSLRFLGDVRANSTAVLLPMPEEAPVTTTVLPSRRLAIAEAIVLVVLRVRRDLSGAEIDARERGRGIAERVRMKALLCRRVI